MCLRYLLYALGVSCVVDGTGVVSRSPYAMKETHRVPHNWARVGKAPPEHEIELQIGLRQARFHELTLHHLIESQSTTRDPAMLYLTTKSLFSDTSSLWGSS